MFKTKLHQLCQQRQWGLPEYSTVKEGLDHQPIFSASVKVKDKAFQIPTKYRTSKEAQNAVAQVAFEHFTTPAPIPDPVIPAIQEAAISEVSLVSSPQSSLPVSQCVTLATQGEVSPVSPPQSLPQVPLCEVSPVIQEAPISEVSPVSSPQSFVLVSQCVSLPNQGAEVPEVSPMQISPCDNDAKMEPANTEALQKTCEDFQQVHIVYRIPAMPANVQDVNDKGVLAANGDANIEPANTEVLQQNDEDAEQVPIVYRMSLGDRNYKDTLHLCKHRLRQYAEKKCLGLPIYSHVMKGPHHAPLFKSKVTLEEISYETVEFFSTLKEADHAASMVACQFLGIDVSQENAGSYKSFLSDFAKKKSLPCPSYVTSSLGTVCEYSFLCTVEIGSDTYKGEVAKSKKQAELNAAKVAYYALSERVPSGSESAIADNLTQIAAKNKHYKVSDEEEAEGSAKRAKSSPTNVIKNTEPSTHVDTPSDSLPSFSNVAEPFSEQSSSHTTPQILHLPTGNNPSVIPRSENLWLAYKREINGESII